MKPDALVAFQADVLSHLPRAALEAADDGFGDVLCSTLARMLAKSMPTRIGCVRLLQ